MSNIPGIGLNNVLRRFVLLFLYLIVSNLSQCGFSLYIYTCTCTQTQTQTHTNSPPSLSSSTSTTDEILVGNFLYNLCVYLLNLQYLSQFRRGYVPDIEEMVSHLQSRYG